MIDRATLAAENRHGTPIAKTEPIIVFETVDTGYGSFRVLKNINLTVAKGEKIVVCGPSGPGKSTLIRGINRLEGYRSGRILVDGIGARSIAITSAASKVARLQEAGTDEVIVSQDGASCWFPNPVRPPAGHRSKPSTRTRSCFPEISMTTLRSVTRG